MPSSFEGEDQAFTKMLVVKKIDLSHTKIKKVPNGLCSGNKSLKEVALPKTCIEIGDGAFNECDSLGVMHAPNVSAIGIEAFHNCNMLTDVVFASGVSIGNNAFAGCESLEEFNIPVSDLGYYAFNDTGVTKMTWTGKGKFDSTQFQKGYWSDFRYKLNILRAENKLSPGARAQIEKIREYGDITFLDK